MFCVGCPLRAECTKPCREVEALLPKDQTARLARAYTKDARVFLAALERRHREVLLMLDYRDKLRGRQRQVFDMKYFDGLSQDEAAVRLHVSRRVVGTYLQRALKRINKLMGSTQRHAH